MPPWYLPAPFLGGNAQGVEITLGKLSKTRLGTINKRDREQRQGGLWDPLTLQPLFSPQLSPSISWGPGGLAFTWKSWGLPTVAEQDLHRKGDSSPPSFSQAFNGEVKVSTHPAIEWGSKPPLRVLLTLDSGKSTLSLFLPLHFGSSLCVLHAMRFWKCSTCHETFGGCASAQRLT